MDIKKITDVALTYEILDSCNLYIEQKGNFRRASAETIFSIYQKKDTITEEEIQNLYKERNE